MCRKNLKRCLPDESGGKVRASLASLCLTRKAVSLVLDGREEKLKTMLRFGADKTNVIVVLVIVAGACLALWLLIR